MSVEQRNIFSLGKKKPATFDKQNFYNRISFWKKFARYFAVITSAAILLFIGQVSMLEGTLFKGLDLANASVNGLGVQFDSNNGSQWIATVFNDNGSGFDPGTVQAQLGAYHCKTAGEFSCAPDIAGDVLATLRSENVLLPIPNKGGSTQVTYDISQVNCGRVQIDLGLANGGGILGGKVYNFGTNCPDANPTPTPGSSAQPTPTPGGQACTPGEWSGATCARCNASGTGMNADGSDWGDFSSNSSGWCGCAQKYAQSTQGKSYDGTNYPQCFGAQPTPTPTPGTCVALGAPQNLLVDGQPSGTTFPTDKRTFNLSWNAVSGATGYDVRLDDPRTPENPDIRQDNVQGTTLQVTLRDPGVTYFWWIHSVNSCGGSAANNANFSIAGSGGPASPTPTPTSTPTSGSCDQFANSTICGQRSYDTCSPVCLSDGTAAYNCQASQNSNCQGTIMCTTENSRCQANPTPSSSTSCAQYVNSTTCGQSSYDTCSPACTADGHAIYNCVASQRSDCTGTLYCDPENARCQASPTPTPNASCPLPMNPGNLLTNGQVDEASFASNQTNFNLTWNAVSGATSYTVTVDDISTSNNPDIVQNNVTGTALLLTINNPGRYTWNVKANNSCGASGTGSIDFTILQPGASPTPTPSGSSTSSSTSSATGGQGGNVTLHITQQTTPVPQVAGATAQLTELPRTGLPVAAWAAAAFLPLGLKMRSFARGLNRHNLSSKAHYINRRRMFKK